MQFQRASSLKGEIRVPGDKSISHRAIMFAALAKGRTEVTNFLQGDDCLATIGCFRQLGIAIDNTPEKITIHGQGLDALRVPAGVQTVLDAKNSGTLLRLIAGILAGKPLALTLTGDASIQKRPMKRIIDPLTMMGADITSIPGNGCAPLYIKGMPLHGIHYVSPIASAQVKSSILLAGLFAEGETSITEPYVSRNHSEIMLRFFGANVTTGQTTATIQPRPLLLGQTVEVPGDISSAAYFIAAGLITPNSEILIRNVGINPTRDGMLRAAKQMGANITLLNISETNGEKTADILVRSSTLHGTIIEGALIPALIDELPVIAVMAAYASGQTIIRDAAELKVKESDRIAVIVEHLSAMGADITATDDGMVINGGRPLHGALIDSKSDHRVAMSFAIAALNADGVTTVKGAEWANVSYPAFYGHLQSLQR